MGDAPARGIALRPFNCGDIAMIAARHALIRRDLIGAEPEIEARATEITARFIRDLNSGRERCWVAELDGAIAGAAVLTDEGAGTCRLRLLYVEPFARRLGIGAMLLSTCTSFARMAGHAWMTLRSPAGLEAARHLYAAHGFRVIDAHADAHVDAHADAAFSPLPPSETWRLEHHPIRLDHLIG